MDETANLGIGASSRQALGTARVALHISLRQTALIAYNVRERSAVYYAFDSVQSRVPLGARANVTHDDCFGNLNWKGPIVTQRCSHTITPRRQQIANMPADESRCSGDQHARHGSTGSCPTTDKYA
jgi:hypothetical protein